MKLKLRLILISYSHDGGFVIPLITGIGLIMIVVGMTLFRTSQREQETTVIRQQTTQSLSLAEAGIVETLSYLNRFTVLVDQNLKDWPEIATSIPTSDSDACSQTPASTSVIDWVSAAKKMADADTTNDNQAWINLSKGQYRILSYQVNDKTGILNVEGREGADSSAITALEVTLPIVTDSSSAGVPGLWLPNKVDPPANIATDASIQADICLEGSLPSDPSKLSNSKLTGPGTLDFPAGDDPGITENTDEIPPLPNLPSVRYDLASLDASDCYIMLPRIPDSEREEQSSNFLVSGLSNNCGSFNSSTSDVPEGKIYSYFFQGSDSIKLSNAQILINPPPGTTVAIYLEGNVTISGTSNSTGAPSLSCVGTTNDITTYIGHPTDASKVVIYGSAEFGNPEGNPNYGGSIHTGVISISDTTLINGFVFAPDADLQLSQGQVKGSAWVKEIHASSSSGCSISISQQNVGSIAAKLAGLSRTDFDPINSWQRKKR